MARCSNCVTEIRDENGYEWSPTSDVAADRRARHGAARRAFNSRVLATLFTHEYYVQSIGDADWRPSCRGSARTSPRTIDLDDDGRCLPLRSRPRHSSITSGTYDAVTQSASTR